MHHTAPAANHVFALQQKHARLDQQIESEAQRPLPDALTMAELKKQKLRVKEALAAF